MVGIVRLALLLCGVFCVLIAGVSAVAWDGLPPVMIAFMSGRENHQEVFVSLMDGSGARNISQTDFPVVNVPQHWSPDGRWLLYESSRAGGADLFLTSRLGGLVRNLTAHPALDRSGAWSPDSQWIAFTSMRDGDAEIYIVRPDGSGLTNLTRSPATIDGGPVWSPDSTRIAYTAWADDVSSLRVVELAAPSPRILSDHNTADIAWSPDGRSLSFSSGPGEQRAVFILNDFSEQIEVSAGLNANSWGAVWSADSAHIAFMARRSGEEPEIYTAARDGSRLTNISRNAASDTLPQWSPAYPDMLGFISARDGSLDIFVWDGVSLGNVSQGSGLDNSFQWTPDGSAIIFRSDRDGNSEIYRVAPDGSALTNVTRSGFTEETPVVTHWDSQPRGLLLALSTGALLIMLAASRLYFNKLQITVRQIKHSQ